MKPCPFCGNTAPQVCTQREIEPMESSDPGFYAVVCDFNNKGCGATGGYRARQEDAITAWDTRA